MTTERVAVSTGEIDRRCINGNNGTRRGPDKKPRKKRTPSFVLKPEVEAGIAARTRLIIQSFGSMACMSRELGVRINTVKQWRTRGKLSALGAARLESYYIRHSKRGFSGRFARPDLEFDPETNAPVSRRPKNPKLLVGATEKRKARKAK